MKQFVSISQYPGTQGKYFYTEFFKLYNIPAEYNPLPMTSEALVNFLQSAKQNNINGISVSMPFKKQIIDYLDIKSESVETYNTCNTVVIDNQKLVGYNTDIEGVKHACKFIKVTDRITILGNGCMGKMFLQHLSNNKYFHIKIFSPSLKNWDDRHKDADVIINCTSLGTKNLESPLANIGTTVKLIIDLSIKVSKLADQAKNLNIVYIGGQEFYKHQFVKQFWLYTQIYPTVDDYNRISLNKYD